MSFIIITYKKILLISIVLLLFFNGYLKSQVLNTTQIQDSVVKKDEIPNLQIFLESAIKNSPLIKASDRQISQIFEKIKIEKKSWTDFVILDANAKYGLLNQLTITDLGTDGSSEIGINSNKEQFNYFLGLSLRFPISEIAYKKNEMKILNENLEEKKLQKEEIINQLKQLVIEEYYNLQYLNKSLKINQEMLQAFSISLSKAEREFKSGIMSLENFNTLIVQKGKTEDSYYKIQSEYFAQYKKLQILTGLNINNTK